MKLLLSRDVDLLKTKARGAAYSMTCALSKFAAEPNARDCERDELKQILDQLTPAAEEILRDLAKG
jgi:hypothetical protein